MAGHSQTAHGARRRRRKGEEALLAALASGHSQQEASKIAGVSKTTVRRCVADPLFRLELDDLKRQIVQQTAASLADASTAAVATLKVLLQSRDEYVRLKASKEILDVTIRYRETLELTERLAALEERANELAVLR